MKLAKLFFSALLALTFFVSSIGNTVTQNYSPKSKKDFLVSASSNYIEYVVIDGITWVIVYSNDGKETDRYPLE